MASRTSTAHWSNSSGSGCGSGNSSSTFPPTTASTVQPAEERLLVAVRVRPSQDTKDLRCIQVNSDKTLLFNEGIKNRTRNYRYDHVFGEETTQVIYTL